MTVATETKDKFLKINSSKILGFDSTREARSIGNVEILIWDLGGDVYYLFDDEILALRLFAKLAPIHGLDACRYGFSENRNKFYVLIDYSKKIQFLGDFNKKFEK